MVIDKIDEGLFRLKIPFEDLTTTVYFYTCWQGTAIIDSATYPSDVDEYILPALDKLHIPRTAITHLLLTHNHEDHAGGFARLREVFPHAEAANTLEDGKTVVGSLRAVFLPGHTYDSYGFFDTATKTLLSGDCLQLAGIGCYRDNISNYKLYLESIEKLQKMDICRIVAAHEFDPLGSIAEGIPAVDNYLEQCERIARNTYKE